MCGQSYFGKLVSLQHKIEHGHQNIVIESYYSYKHNHYFEFCIIHCELHLVQGLSPLRW